SNDHRPHKIANSGSRKPQNGIAGEVISHSVYTKIPFSWWFKHLDLFAKQCPNRLSKFKVRMFHDMTDGKGKRLQLVEGPYDPPGFDRSFSVPDYSTQAPTWAEIARDNPNVFRNITVDPDYHGEVKAWDVESWR
ncbi:hypothetical protein LCGC14_2444700, partial [marine sediment metagenome]